MRRLANFGQPTDRSPEAFAIWAKECLAQIQAASQASDLAEQEGLASDIAEVASDLTDHIADLGNPHAVTKAQVGLGNVPNVDATLRSNHTGTQSISTIVGVATIAALKALTVPASGDRVYIRGGSSDVDGKHGWWVYVAVSSETADDFVYVQPTVGGGRWIREEWFHRNEIHARWWGFVLNATGSQVANGLLIEDLFDFIQASAQSGTCFFQRGILYLEMTDAYTFSKVRGWTFRGVSEAGVSISSGSRIFLRGGGLDYFIKYRTVVQFNWHDVLFIIQGSGMDGILDWGAEPYYDALDADHDGNPAPDTTAISSLQNSMTNCMLTADWAGGFEPAAALLHLHSTVVCRFNNVWFTGCDRGLKLGEESDNDTKPDFRMLARGSTGQIAFNDCTFECDIDVLRASEIAFRGGQISRQGGLDGNTRAAMITTNAAADVFDGFLFEGVGLGAVGDGSDVFIRSDIAHGVTIDPTCTVGLYNYVVEADGACEGLDISPTVHSTANGRPTTGILQILSTCTGKRLESRTPYHSDLTFIVKEERLALSDSPRPIRKNFLRNGEMRLWFGSTSFSPSALNFFAEAWRINFNGSGATRTLSRQTRTVGTEPDSASPYYFRYAKSVAGTGATTDNISSRIPHVATLAGKVCVLSFRAVADSTYTLTPFWLQNFGTGGSPSTLDAANLTAQTITTAEKRFMVVFSLPSISGKTLGTNGDDYALIGFTFPLNATHQIDISDVKLEEGFIPSSMLPRGEADIVVEQLPFSEKIGSDLANDPIGIGYANSTTHAFVPVKYHPKRSHTPTVTVVGTVASDFEIERAASTAVAPSAIAATSGRIGRGMAQIDVTVASGLTAGEGLQLKAKTTSGYILVRAEP